MKITERAGSNSWTLGEVPIGKVVTFATYPGEWHLVLRREGPEKRLITLFNLKTSTISAVSSESNVAKVWNVDEVVLSAFPGVPVGTQHLVLNNDQRDLL